MSVRPRRRCSRADPRDTTMRSHTLSHAPARLRPLVGNWTKGQQADRQPHPAPRRTPMATISEVQRLGLPVRVFHKVVEAMLGKVPTPERIMAHRVPLMLGLGALYG